VNTDAFYEHPAHQREPDAATMPLTEAELSVLARHGDPSLARPTSLTHRTASERSIAWVRPSELATTVASPVVKGGAEFQTNIARRARKAPTRAVQRVTRSAIARPEQSAPTQEGLGL
jgi:hypothetical protein